MIRILSFIAIFALCRLCIAAEDINLLVASEWSKPISLQDDALHDEAIRGRLLIIQGLEPAYGGPPTTNAAMTFIELQNVTGSSGGGIDIYFAVTNLHCQLSDVKGKVQENGGAGGRGPFSPCWLRLPYNSTIRLFIDGGNLEPLTIWEGSGSARWSIPKSDTNVYYLTGTLTLFTRTNAAILAIEGPREMRDSYYNEHCKGTLIFPKTKITTAKISGAGQTK